MVLKREQQILGILRIGLGFIFFWAFIDKLCGLGFSTLADKSWVLGNSPTAGFLTKAAYGPFASFFQSLAGSSLVDWLFMIGLLFIGLSLILGMGVKIAGWTGSLMLVLMYLAMIPPKNNPFLDDHIIYAIVLVLFTQIKVGYWFGFGKWWSQFKIVRKNPYLE